jgi:AraC-like DNA-binding protein
VAGGDAEEVAGGHGDLGAVVHADRGLPGGYQPDVLDLARCRADQWCDVLGPAPAGGVDGTSDLLVAERVQLEASEGKRAYIVGFCGCDNLQRKWHDAMMADQVREVLDGIAVPSSSGAASGDRARYFRPPALPGVEALHASFVTHRYPAHLHESWTVATVNRGAATFELEGSRHVAPAGTTFLVPPGAVHTGEPATPDGYRYQVLYIAAMGESDATDAFLTSRPGRGAPVVLRHQELSGKLARLHAALTSPAAALEQGETLSLATAVLAAIISDQDPASSSHRPRAVSEAIGYIHAHLVEDFSLRDLAAAVGVSPYYLVRTFHERVGMPPSSYRRASRVLAAQRLLRLGRRPAEVAAECGFYDQSHLNRYFKSVTGVTPRQYALAS